MTADQPTSPDGEKSEAESQNVTTFLHGTAVFECEPEVSLKGSDPFVQLALRGDPSISVVMTERQAELLRDELADALEEL